MSQFGRVKHYCQLILFIPFFLIALVPQGMMLSQSPEQSDNILIICSANGVYRISASELSVDTVIPNIHSGAQQHDADAQDTSCPYSIANSGFFDTSVTLKVIYIAHVQPKLLAAYRSQYTLRLHPVSYPRGPPLSV